MHSHVNMVKNVTYQVIKHSWVPGISHMSKFKRTALKTFMVPPLFRPKRKTVIAYTQPTWDHGVFTLSSSVKIYLRNRWVPSGARMDLTHVTYLGYLYRGQHLVTRQMNHRYQEKFLVIIWLNVVIPNGFL